MYYSKIIVENFKGIKKVEIDFVNNRIITLVGLNESGKTTILEAINLFYQLIKDKTLSTKEINSLRPKGIDFTGAVKIDGELMFEEKDYKQIKTYLNKSNYLAPVEIPPVFGYTYNFNFKLHSYQNLSRTSNFLAKNKGKKNLLHKSNNKLWLDLINYIREDIVPEILLYEDFVFDIPNDIVFKIGDTETSDVPSGAEEIKNFQWQQVINDIIKTVNSQFTSFQEYVVNIWEKDNDTARQRVNAMEKLLDKKITVAWKELFNEDEKGKT